MNTTTPLNKTIFQPTGLNKFTHEEKIHTTTTPSRYEQHGPRKFSLALALIGGITGSFKVVGARIVTSVCS